MAPRSTTLPSAQTESARELARRFFCELCGKGYARINEFEAHETSYDHQHRKRAKEMRALTRNPTAAVRDNREMKKRKENSEMLSMNLQASDGSRPSNASGFRDATQVKGGVVSNEAVKSFTTEARGKGMERKEEEGTMEKVSRPPMWHELDQFNSLVDVSALPREMQDREAALPWGQIWSNHEEMDKLLKAVDGEMEGLEEGAARKSLQRAWLDMSEASDESD